MKKAIPYYRVSTERQGVSGLGLEAQKQMIKDFAKMNDFDLTEEFIEVESGKRNKRPVLRQALQACKSEHATLLIAKLDRLARNVAFVSSLMEARVDFKAVDNPHATKLIVHIMAAFAEHESDMISQRTSAALKVAKMNGVELGKYGRDVLSTRNKQQANRFAKELQPTITRLRRSGIKTVRAIAAELNRLQVPTYYKTGQWHASTVHGILKRMNMQ